MAANVVDLPDPVGPVTRIRPWRDLVSSASDGRHPKLFQRVDLQGDKAADHAHRAALLIDIRADACDAFDHKSDVQLVPVLEPADLLVRHHAVRQAAVVVRASAAAGPSTGRAR